MICGTASQSPGMVPEWHYPARNFDPIIRNDSLFWLKTADLPVNDKAHSLRIMLSIWVYPGLGLVISR